VDFAVADDFDWQTAQERADSRRDCGEVRVRALGRIGNRVHVMIYTQRGEVKRLISLRNANDKEYLEWISHAEPDRM